MAAQQPERAALKIPRGRTRDGAIDYLTLSFAELDAEVDAWVAEMSRRGLRRGDRTLVMVRPGLPLIAAVFALFKLGAIPVVIDPGMGLRQFLRCVRQSHPRALVGIPAARWLSRLARSTFRGVTVRVPVSGALTARRTRAAVQSGTRESPSGRPALWTSRAASKESAGETGSTAVMATSDLAAVLFTSGSTGAPKGVVYTHGQFEAQVGLIRATYGIEPGEIDLPLLPIFALFNPALGMTTIVPEIDPKRPARVDAAKILQAIRQEKVTNSFGSPTLWGKIAAHALDEGITLPTMRRVLCAGAPVPPALWEMATAVLPNGQLHSPYGATEALPVSTIDAREVIRITAARTLEGAGTCVGRPIDGVAVRIVPIMEGAIASMTEVRALPAGEIGEIVVRGPNVTHSYDARPEATALAKIREGNLAEGVWHRMGDCGYFDEEGRLWFCGRKAERLQTVAGPLFTEQVEPMFNQHPAVKRCALVGVGEVGRQRPVLVVEVAERARANEALQRSLQEFSLRRPLSARVTEFLFHPGFPVDVRHNAKVHRLALARWAARASRSASKPGNGEPSR